MAAKPSSKNPGTNLFLCFAEFDNAWQATVALSGLQGYRFDVKVDKSDIRIRCSLITGGHGAQLLPRALPAPHARPAPPHAPQAPNVPTSHPTHPPPPPPP